MSDDPDLAALKAALKATPAPLDAARKAALDLAMENFDRLQGSREAARLIQDRPARAGLLKGARDMWNSMTSRLALAATTSVLALVVGVGVVLTLNPLPGRLGQTTLPAEPVVVDQTAATPPGLDTRQRDQPALLPLAEERSEQPATPPAPTVSADLEADALPLQDQAPAGEAAPLSTIAPPPPLSKQAAPEMGTAGGIAQDEAADSFARTAAPMAVPDAMLAQPLPDTEEYSTAAPNPLKITAEEPVSTFSVDVDTAAYAVIRSSLNMGYLPPPEAVRVEEMVNYFPYAYPAPAAGEAPFRPTVTAMPTPWNSGTRLVHIALQGRMPALEDRPPLNLVFLIDTSGSMDEPNKLPLLKQSLTLMLGQLRAEDQVAIVAYAGSAGQVLAPTAAGNRAEILAALDRLQAGGSTAGAEGLALAYQVAEGMAGEGEVSRVLLATDGDFNVGIDDPEGLTAYIARKRESGVFLSVLGFGRGNLDDATMQALAQNGNGQAAYIDTLQEAQKSLVDQLTGALFAIAQDVKIQVEWNPAEVAEYRLIGYETRALNREDFNNDRVDAGEIGAGLQVTALYEVTAPDSPALRNDPLRYGEATAVPATDGELGFLRLRYKEPGEDTSQLIETPIRAGGEASDDTRFAAAIAGFGQLLQHSTYLNDWGWDQAIALANGAKGPDEYGYRAEAVQLMRLAQSLSN
jgi:Ca-activated chloride channel family protein